jgi:hypothetical protein
VVCLFEECEESTPGLGWRMAVVCLEVSEYSP